MEKDPSTASNTVKHLTTPGGSSWVGLVDGIYAIAMTLIAIDLPELIRTLLSLPRSLADNALITRLVIYEFTAYIATFLVLYDLWSHHRCVLKIGGLKRQTQNLLNGFILSLSCLGAGNIILVLNEKASTATEAIRKNVGEKVLFSTWVNSHSSLVLVTFMMVAIMFFAMAIMARSSTEYSTSTDLRHLSKDLFRKGFFFFVALTTWIPKILGQPLPMPPAILVIIFIAISYNQHHIARAFRKE